jgi:hypothetical protein
VPRTYDPEFLRRGSAGGRDHRGTAQCLCVSGPPSTVEVAAAAPAVRLGPELPLKLIEAPDLGAVRSKIRLDASSQVAHGG